MTTVGIDDGLKHLPVAEDGAAEVEIAGAGAVLVGDGAAGRAGRLRDARTGEGAGRVMAGVVDHHHRGGAGSEAEADQLADQLRVGVGGLLRRCGPRRSWV